MPKTIETTKIIDTLNNRQKLYGVFSDRADFLQDLKEFLKERGNWENLSNPQKESIEMIANKVSRILFGNPNQVDNWHDIAGYATLIEEELKGNKI